MSERKEQLRKMAIINSTIAVGLGLYLILKEEEDAEEDDSMEEDDSLKEADAEERRAVEEDSNGIKRRTSWNPILQRRNMLKTNRARAPSIFYENFHMTETLFNHLFSLVEPHLRANRNSRPDAIPLKIKLAMILEMLATGVYQNNLVSTYQISKQHIGPTTDRVCDAICLALAGEFPKWTKENMLKWANEFEKLSNFPNCVGAISGKHVQITVPSLKAKSNFLNYKGFTSIVLIAVCDASSKFTYIDVGEYGSRGDTAFSQSNIENAILWENMEFPENRTLNGIPTPYFFIGNEPFPLDKHVMKRYNRGSLGKPERTYNKQLKQVYRCNEKALEILCAKWMAVQRTSLKCPDRAQKMVAACCYLHNFMMRNMPEHLYVPKNLEAHRVTALIDLATHRGRYNDYPKYVRNNVRDYMYKQPEDYVMS